ncbi:MAG TPA: tetratricopeptide repeat protein [Candidatus Omnitrophota bacterium]|nr:tetratricopeptide repeat protein [Candidatus Omnitrophota bacterium]HPB67342.1 tetratricopeptide repeat protein [Candidatus Omnitrophota bacterium]HQO57397.1 tetratricopeptide repeat protein [Candidatus Omnitrophota bacterium]HQP11567.1 tetratricopeptide repeat protein [Candidatus Omnitrophota bacterium]
MKRGCLIFAIMICAFGCEQKKEVKLEVPVPTPAAHDFMKDGIEYLEQAKVPEAIKSFDEAIKQNPVDPQPYLLLGQTYMRISDYTRAIDTFSAALRVSPDKGSLHYLIAVNYRLMGDVELARKNVEASIEFFRQKQDEKNFLMALALLQELSQEQNK